VASSGAGVEVKNMQEIILRYLEVFGIVGAAIGACVFGWKQYQINKRMQELADYVAISIIPLANFQLQIMNVGRANLYIHKWELGYLSETYVKPLLVPTEAKSSIIINLQPPLMGQHLLKIYLTDEGGKKYLSTGEVVIEPVAFQIPPSTTQPQVQQELQVPSQPFGVQPINIKINMRAWSYKTEKHDWVL
jgi:hypothetical protein